MIESASSSSKNTTSLYSDVCLSSDLTYYKGSKDQNLSGMDVLDPSFDHQFSTPWELADCINAVASGDLANRSIRYVDTGSFDLESCSDTLVDQQYLSHFDHSEGHLFPNWAVVSNSAHNEDPDLHETQNLNSIWSQVLNQCFQYDTEEGLNGTPTYYEQLGNSSYPFTDGETLQETGVRVISNAPEPICIDHGCNGRRFSTWSNLIRHQREKAALMASSTCQKCQTQFKTARGLVNHKCSTTSKRHGAWQSDDQITGNSQYNSSFTA